MMSHGAMNNRDNRDRHEDHNRSTGAAEQVKLTRGQKAASAGQEVRPGSMWLKLIAVLAVASVALVSDGALFSESGQIVAVVIVLCVGLVLTVSRWRGSVYSEVRGSDCWRSSMA